MRISELSARSGLPVGTIKFYLREGLLPAGRRTSRTTAEYDDAHLERLRLVRALGDPGGLDLAAIRRVLAAIDTPDPRRIDVLATAQDALLGAGDKDADEGTTEDTTAEGAAPAPGGEAATAGAAPPASGDDARARAWARSRGWITPPGDAALHRLEQAWAAARHAGLDLDAERLGDYADAMARVAEIDVDSVPEDPRDAVRQVVVGTVMIEPVLAALRLLTQRELSLARTRGTGAEDEDQERDAGRD